jgi:phenylacetate-CoA ligase
MGSWVGGVFSTFCIRELTAFNYKLTLMTPGNVMADILKILSGLIPSLFEQVCIVGYPPFCKGVIDNALGSGIDLKALRLKFILAGIVSSSAANILGEVFSEEWRTLMMTRCKILQASDIVSIYGTADAGVLGCETPLTIHLRRLISSASREVCSDVFGKDRYLYSSLI